MSENTQSKAYLVGGGIASLASAVYLVQEGKFKGENITIFDEASKIGGSLDGEKIPESGGYSVRGIRLFEEKVYSCLFDLMSRIPYSATNNKTLLDEFIDYNKKNKSYSKSRLIRDGHTIDPRPLTLNVKDRISLFRLLISRESSLQNKEIQDYFTPSFFISNFWYEFCTVFSFQPWHSVIEFRRYFVRFIQSFPNVDTLKTAENTPYNQHDFLVVPILHWLQEQGVKFITDTKVNNFEFESKGEKTRVSRIYYTQNTINSEIVVSNDDYVFSTLGSMVANSSIGTMSSTPLINVPEKSSAWTLWEKIAKDRPEFGKPSVFNSHIDKSKWTSFTVTFRDPDFFNLIEKHFNKKITSYGGFNLLSSNWLITIILFYKPYFVNQPEGATISWGYGLFPDRNGNFVNKKMSECTGEEILTEILHHLGFEESFEKIIKSSICIPCSMPYITSQFLPRKTGDRPPVVPRGATNFAFLGQYVEIPEDVVFTVEYSVRSAQMAVYSLLKLKKKVSPIYRGTHHVGVLYRALKTVFR